VTVQHDSQHDSPHGPAGPAAHGRVIHGSPGCPAASYTDIMAPMRAGEHLALFDQQREQADFLFGDAGGHDFWVATKIDDIRAILQDGDTFSSDSLVASDPNPEYRWIPEMLGGQEHTKWRQLLGQFFAPSAVEKLKPRMYEVINEIIDDVIDQGGCDFVHDVALRYPTTVFVEWMGLPTADIPLFQHWETEMMHNSHDTERSVPAMTAVIDYFQNLVAERRRAPQDDLLSIAATWQIDGVPVDDNDLLATCLGLFIAALDSVGGQLGYSMMHLATHESDRKRLLAEPKLWQSGIEELLRYYSFVVTSRKITRDVDLNGCPMKAGQMVFVAMSAASRDPQEFPDADKVILDRKANRHLAFGAGRHRCLGSHLARAELMVALPEWHRRIPDYRLVEGSILEEHGGVIGLDNLPLIWR
jgi:cytochrome P450